MTEIHRGLLRVKMSNDRVAGSVVSAFGSYQSALRETPPDQGTGTCSQALGQNLQESGNSEIGIWYEPWQI